MLDNPLIIKIREIIIAQEEVAGIPGLPIKQAFQPTQQGVDKTPAAYFYILGYRRIGFPETEDVYDEDQEKMIETTLQQYETDIQISALSTQNPATPEQLTAGDLLNLIAYTLQNLKTVELLRVQGIGILRIRDVRNPYFKDDRGRFEASPSFDFTITHKQIVTTEVDVLQSTELDIYRV